MIAHGVGIYCLSSGWSFRESCLFVYFFVYRQKSRDKWRIQRCPPLIKFQWAPPSQMPLNWPSHGKNKQARSQVGPRGSLDCSGTRLITRLLKNTVLWGDWIPVSCMYFLRNSKVFYGMSKTNLKSGSGHASIILSCTSIQVLLLLLCSSGIALLKFPSQYLKCIRERHEGRPRHVR